MIEAGAPVSVSAQSLPIERAENFGKILPPSPAGRTLLSLPGPGGFPGLGAASPGSPAERSRWPRAHPTRGGGVAPQGRRFVSQPVLLL